MGKGKAARKNTVASTRQIDRQTDRNTTSSRATTTSGVNQPGQDHQLQYADSRCVGAGRSRADGDRSRSGQILVRKRRAATAVARTRHGTRLTDNLAARNQQQRCMHSSTAATTAHPPPLADPGTLLSLRNLCVCPSTRPELPINPSIHRSLHLPVARSDGVYEVVESENGRRGRRFPLGDLVRSLLSKPKRGKRGARGARRRGEPVGAGYIGALG